MDYKDLIKTAYCCDIKACDDCPSKGRTCCRERAMQELSHALDKEAERSEAAEAAQETLQRAMAEYKDRAEKAERERDAAIKELDGVSSAVDDLADFIDREIHPIINYNLYLDLRENADAISMFQHEREWRGQKEE